MGQKSLIESKGASAFALRLFAAANCAALRLLSSAHAQVQVQREATVIPSRVETRKNSNLDTSVTAAHDDNGGLTYVRSPRKAKSMRITSWRLAFHGPSLEFLWNKQGVIPPERLDHGMEFAF
ncbi:MAG: hypothetical protein LAO78_25245 [Acidobacteriia bacterium]|nr:hypothetical protein [Terriglobia bacterium]